MSRYVKQLFCDKHGPYTLWQDAEGRLYRSQSGGGISSSGNFGLCPKCSLENQKKTFAFFLKAAMFILVAFVFIFVGLPKIIYEKSGGGAKGKRNVIIYYASWVVVVLSIVIINSIVDEMNLREAAQRHFKSAYASDDIKTMEAYIGKADISDINLSNEIETCLSKPSRNAKSDYVVLGTNMSEETKCATKIRLFLEHGKKADEKDAVGKTPLLIAASYGSYIIASDLLNPSCMNGKCYNKADVNLAFKKNGNTPLHFAVASGSSSLVELLVEKGADKNAKNNKGQTPLDIAIDNDIKEYLNTGKTTRDRNREYLNKSK